jgi:hypothetical protein
MSAFATFRSLAFLSIITCGLITAAWDGAKAMPWVHDQDRGDVVWIDTRLPLTVPRRRFWRRLVRGGSSFLTFAVRNRATPEQEPGAGDISFKMSEADPARRRRLGDAGPQEASSWGYHRG